MIIPGAPTEITASELLEKVSEIDIANRYITNFKQVGLSFKSELRSDRKKGNCFVFKDGVTGRLMYKDFADPNIPTKITLFEYISIKYRIGIQEAINMVARDFNITCTKGILYEGVKSNILHYNTVSEEEEKSSSDLTIKIKKRDWTNKDKEYWGQYSIPIDLLERNNIYSISHIWLYRDDKQIFFTEFSNQYPVYSYNYYWHNNVFRRKIYRPLSSDYKWTTNTDYTVVQNYPNIPKEGELLFIQSSYKDCMVMEMMGYPAIAPNAESCWLPPEYWEKIKKRWDNIVIFGNNDWDNKDNPGVKYAERHSLRYKIPYIITPTGTTSDISDYVKVYGLDKAKELTKRLLDDIYKR